MSVLKSLIIAAILTTTVGGLALADDPPVEWDGLQKKKVKGIDLAYVRPGVDLSVYGKVMLDPVQVAFAKNWKPEKPGSRVRVSQEERELIMRRLAALFEKTFTETLSKKDGYPVVTAAGPDVMRVSAALADVYITAPDLPTAGRSYTYVVNAGRMTLVAEMRDSETGALFARVIDAREARDNTNMMWSNSVENSAEARRIVTHWANILRSRMDAVRAQAKTE